MSPPLPDAHLSEIIEMALSDHVSFSDIEREYRLTETQVKALMRGSLKPGSYRAWRCALIFICAGQCRTVLQTRLELLALAVRANVKTDNWVPTQDLGPERKVCDKAA